MFDLTLLTLFKNNKCVNAQYKNKNYFDKYYNKDYDFIETCKKLLNFCDEIWFIKFDEFLNNTLNCIKVDNTGFNFIDSKKIENEIEFYEKLKLTEKFNVKLVEPFLNNIVWWFDCNGFINSLEKYNLLQNEYKDFLKSGYGKLYNNFNKIISVILDKNIITRKYSIIIENKLSYERETIYNSYNLPTIDVIKSCLYDYFDTTDLSSTKIKSLIEINKSKQESNYKKQEVKQKWIIDIWDDDRHEDVYHEWVYANSKEEAIRNFKEDNYYADIAGVRKA